ncbi:MAG TPA: Ig-like domain-containing protein, partial [Actinomycetota bacterium]|nr:Ig-like domain-containing protein [Actinomycetota bacterium]
EGMTKTGRPDGVPIDGKNDDVGNIDSTPVRDNTYFDASDPTFGLPLAIYNWEQVSGPNGSLVYMFQLNNVQGAENPAVIPYYRDDSCFDDGTGDDPSPRLYPGSSYANMRNSDDPEARAYTERPCWGEDPDPANPPTYSKTGPWRQGCLACHGVHFLITNDTDNAFLQKPTTEVDGQQFIWAVPTDVPANVGEEYANTVKLALVPTVTSQDSRAPKEATNISNTGPTSGRVDEKVTLSARLTDSAGNELAGRDVRFSLDGQQLGTATTDAGGVARLEVTLQGPARQAQLTESFAGDADYLPSSTTVAFQVERRPTSLVLSVTKIEGRDYRVRATLKGSATGNPLTGKRIDFSRNGRIVASATTNSNGRATVIMRKVKKGTVIAADFARDDTYAASSAQRRV